MEKLNIGSGADYRPAYVNLEFYSNSDQHIEDTKPPDVWGDAHHLPFKDGSFDWIDILHTLEHLEYPIDCVREMHRVLREGGDARIEVPDVWKIKQERDSHWYSWTPWSMENMCKSVGFEIVTKYRGNTSNGPTLGVVVKK